MDSRIKLERFTFVKMEEYNSYKKIRIKLNQDDLARIIKGETIEGWKTSIQKE